MTGRPVTNPASEAMRPVGTIQLPWMTSGLNALTARTAPMKPETMYTAMARTGMASIWLSCLPPLG